MSTYLKFAAIPVVAVVIYNVIKALVAGADVATAISPLFPVIVSTAGIAAGYWVARRLLRGAGR